MIVAEMTLAAVDLASISLGSTRLADMRANTLLTLAEIERRPTAGDIGCRRGSGLGIPDARTSVGNLAAPVSVGRAGAEADDLLGDALLLQHGFSACVGVSAV